MIFPVWHLRHFRFHNYVTFLHLRHFRFYTYVTSGFTPTSLPVLHLRHFRFYTYVTSVFTPTSLPVLYLHHFFTPTSLPVWQLRHFRFHNYVTFLHLHSNARFVKTFIFLTLILVAWEIWRHNLILHQILIYSKKIKNALFVTILQRLFQKLPQKSNLLKHLSFQ